ncbi:MAG: hypothetical protein ACKO1N_11820 [Erythrobacter sp.]
MALAYAVRVSFRRPRPHERFAVPSGYRVVIGVAHTADGPEELPWLVPSRDAKRAFNPRCRDFARLLEAGEVPAGWHRL